MSRSYKKFPFWKDEKSCKKGKKIANNKVRKYLKENNELTNGSLYKKVYDRWNIYDTYAKPNLKEFLNEGYTEYEFYKRYKMK